MSNYFSNFPTVQYNGINAKNLMSRIIIVRDLIKKIATYYPYHINEGERPDQIASDYYGDPNYVWLVYLSNEIIDPYYEWPLTKNQFEDRIYNLYGSIENAYETVVYYTNPSYTYTITPTTYKYMSDEEKVGWSPVDAYTYEYNANENKRSIRLITRKLLSQIEAEIQKVFTERVV